MPCPLMYIWCNIRIWTNSTTKVDKNKTKEQKH